jgi:predicted nucleic acid-binding Zn ribbon protein
MAYCSRCGAPLPPDARFCPACGQPVVMAEPESARSMGGVAMLAVLAGIALVVIAIVVVLQRDGARPVAGTRTASATPSPIPLPTPTPRPTVAPTPEPEADLRYAVIPAQQLDAALADDPGAAARFMGPVTVRGVVGGFGPSDTLALAGRDPAHPVIATIDPRDVDALDLLDRGMAVRLHCAGVLHEQGVTLLEGCRL